MTIQQFPIKLIILLTLFIIIDLVSVILLFRHTNSILLPLLLHSIVSLAGTALLAHKRSKKQKTLFFYGTLFQLIFLLPIIGLIGAFIFSDHSRFINIKEKHDEEIDELLEFSDVNELNQPLEEVKNYRHLLRHQDPETYLQLILSTKLMDEGNAIKILKFALNTDIENVRLLAQARLDNKENNINQTLEKYIEWVQTKKHKKNVRLHLEIAQQYWRLANLGLAKDAVLEHVLKQLQKYTTLAKCINPNESQSYYLSGKAFLLEKNYSEAKKQFLMSVKAGIPKSNVISSLQEIAFFERTTVPRKAQYLSKEI